MKQTAVEWLYDWMWTKDRYYFLESDLALAFSKAELMEKEQIKDAWNDGQSDGATICTQKVDNPSEQYYKKTFKSE